MSEEVPQADPPLSVEEQSLVSKLSDADLQVIDAAILANCSDRWLKVPRVVSSTVDALEDRYPGLSYIFYALRLNELVEQGRLDSAGDLEYMRFSEVRIPAPPS